MNHCFDCNSDYATPGSCNCFAPGGKRFEVDALDRVPSEPTYWIVTGDAVVNPFTVTQTVEEC